MKMLPIFVGLIVLCILAACGGAPTPTPTPLPPTPTSTPMPTATSEPVGDYVPPAIPRCAGVKAMGTALKFDWPGIDDVGEADWHYYHCAQKPEELATFYREAMVNPPYNWLENAWVILPQGTLGVYFHTARQTWLYLWFLADTGAPQASDLVVAERNEVTPLDLPCH